MHFLLLCILSSTGIFIIFKIIDRTNVPALPVIVINYLTATILGFLLHPDKGNIGPVRDLDWLPASLLIGFLFIVNFFLIARSSRSAGLSVTTVASKMSVVFPIIFSLIIDPSDGITPLKAWAILSALAGVGFTVYKPVKNRLDPSAVWLPLLLFVGMGVVDSLVKWSQYSFVGDEDTALFSAALFLNAFLTGFVVLLFRRRSIAPFSRFRPWVWGILLGSVNFGSIYFLVRALNYRDGVFDSSVIFGVNNTGIVALSVLTGAAVFGEKLRPVNWLGIALSALALILFSLR